MKDRTRISLFALTGGILFAAFDRCGYMLKNYGSIWAVSENPLHRTIFHRILCRLPVSILTVLALFLLVDFLGRKWENRADDLWNRMAEKKCWFFCMWFLYFLSFLPAWMGSWPGLFAADAPNQVGWTFSGWLTAHHPLLHTGILCGIFSFCRSFGWSDHTAAAIYTALQMLLLSGIFAWISRFLHKEHAPVWLQIGTAVFLCLLPFHGMMAVYTTKDTVFAGVFVLCVMQIYQMCRAPEDFFCSTDQTTGKKGIAGWGNVIKTGFLFVLLFLLRNNGFHVLLLSMPFWLLVFWKYWKKLLVLFAGVILLHSLYNGPFLKLIGAEEGNAREAYSVIMQTLGRTYVTGSEIFPEEMEVIRPVLDEDTLMLYTQDLSDPVKNHFHTQAFEENKSEFLKTWIQIGLRNKKIYIDAFLHTAAAFWYPNAGGEYLDWVVFDIEKTNPNYPHVTMEPKSNRCYQYYDWIGTRAGFRSIPIVREVLSMGFYFWIMVFAALYVIYRKRYGSLLVMLPFWTYIATGLLGPTALLRYGYPVMLGAPLLLFLLMEKQE